MISSEVTVLFEKACQSEPPPPCPPRIATASQPIIELCRLVSPPAPNSTSMLTEPFPSRAVFIQELAARSHMVSLSSRRRTLSRPDVAQAIAKSDMFDFLIDIVPRDEISPTAGGSGGGGGAGGSNAASHTDSPRTGGGASSKKAAQLPTRGSTRRTRGRRTRQVPDGDDEEDEQEDEEEDDDQGDEEYTGGRQGKRRRTKDAPVDYAAADNSLTYDQPAEEAAPEQTGVSNSVSWRWLLWVYSR